jgi:hypothetical protein
MSFHTGRSWFTPQPSEASAEALAAIGRRVAKNLQLDRHDTVRLPFGLTYVPAGTSVRSRLGTLAELYKIADGLRRH